MLDEDGAGQTRRADVENRSDSHVLHVWFTRSTSTASVRRRCGRVRTLTPRIEIVRTPRSAARTVQPAVRTYTRPVRTPRSTKVLTVHSADT